MGMSLRTAGATVSTAASSRWSATASQPCLRKLRRLWAWQRTAITSLRIRKFTVAVRPSDSRTHSGRWYLSGSSVAEKIKSRNKKRSHVAGHSKRERTKRQTQAMLTSQQQRAACWTRPRWRWRGPASHQHSRTVSQAKTVSHFSHLSNWLEDSLSFLFSIRHQANLFFFAGTNQKRLYSHFAETELHSGRMSKRQLKIVEKNLQREEKLKESRSYVEAP